MLSGASNTAATVGIKKKTNQENTVKVTATWGK